MAIRLTEFLIIEGDTPAVEAVVFALNESWVRDTTALDLLSALAQMGETFVVQCRGDYDIVVNSEDLLDDEVQETSTEWLREILQA